jgi:hypothetical protein
MLFDNIINFCKEELSKNDNIYIVANTVYNKYKSYSKLNMYIILTLINQIINNNINIKCFRDCDFMFDDVVVPSEYTHLQEQFNKLKNLPQPEQRTAEWFEYRQNRITASDTASAIDLNPYEPVEGFILKKCDPNHKFLDNQNVYHGKKYEPIATSIYEYIYNIKVVEFGALPSDKYKLLGASPDGICSSQSLDNKFSPLLGRMLEIKCTVMRKIYTSGKIRGHICPFYYYCQVQQQLECCNLDKCDFWQCKIIEYKNKTDYLIDQCNDTIHTIDITAEKITIDNRIKKGMLIKFLPKVWNPEFDGDNIEWKSKFIYPTNLLMNEKEYDSWCLYNLENWQELYPDIASTHYYEKIVYWKLDSSHNVTIDRDEKFFNNILPILNDTWSKVLYYRDNLNKLDDLRDIVTKRTKYTRMDTKINIHNYLVNDKVLFLNNVIIKENYEVDFID